MVSPALKEYQIGWICALPIEAAAAQEMLDENFGPLEEQENADTNIYTLGRISKHYIVIACLGGQYGTTSITTVANNMMRTFSQSLRVGLLVGVGSGIPSAAHDIRLGDIVYEHPLNAATCDNCSAEWEIKRARREDNEPQPHYGIIASGNVVIKHGGIREQLRKEIGALCFEMEAASLMQDFPCIIIRGICDYADLHRNKQWQGYAALAAASYTKELLSYVPRGQVSQEKLVAEISTLAGELRLLGQRAIYIEQKIDFQGLSIARGSAFDSYENQHEECLKGTRVQLLHDIEEWATLSDEKCIFWLNGKAGTGKSTISRTVASLLEKKGLLGASFFFKRGEEDRGSAKKLFPTIVTQLVNSMPQLLPCIQKAIKNDPHISEKMLREQFEKLLLQPLLEMDQGLTVTAARVIVIDALDECDQEDDIGLILKLLPRVQNSNAVKLRFLLTSRPELSIRFGFKEIADDYQDLILHQIAEPVIEHDISLYFQVKFAQLRQMRSLSTDWPGSRRIKVLTERAVPLFISAVTIYRFISDKKWNPDKRLEAILADNTTYVSKMNSTYMTVLNQLLTGQDKWESQQLLQDFKDIVGIIILLATPLSPIAISQLAKIKLGDINIQLDLLHSVLEIPQNPLLPTMPRAHALQLEEEYL
ncbi:hypothetical protein EYZ11_013317 [Aspergillus tanneri]|uniref:NACHT domain-containing protein n=1 Tax=Aspergillus tanneri TaxID=1220188 RepID=A0A4S3J029_9EURO|nr:hypothetical protein EYZ11_013317 [Aspergillus tanneri]